MNILSLPSSSAKLLAKELGALVVRPRQVEYMHDSLFLNWGVGKECHRTNQRLLNTPRAVRTSASKRSTFVALASAELPIPQVVVSRRAAELARVMRPGSVWLARQDGRHSGRGITVVSPKEPLPAADFYSRYMDILREYRVHVVDGVAILVAQKRRASDLSRFGGEGVPSVGDLVRSHRYGWVQCVNAVKYSREVTKERLEELAVKAIAAVGLDFGAVDIMTSGDNDVYILETNSKVGISGETTTRAWAGALATLWAKCKRQSLDLW